MSEYYTEYSHEQLSKIGNTVIYLAEKIPSISKTKVLKLLYILDELSIRKSGIPFINLKYKVWKFGPVSEDMFIDLSTEPTLLKNYISRETKNDGNTYILPLRAFEDDEFSENDLSLLDYVISEFGNQTAQQLVSYTHRKQSPWHNTAVEKDILDLLENEKISNTEYVINMQMLIQHDENKLQIYREYLESNQMLEEGNIIYFDPFYFKNGNSAKPKYFVVLHLSKHSESVLAALPTRKDSVPEANTIDFGCIELPEINLNCFVFPPNTPLTICGKYFDFPTHIYGHQLDTFEEKDLKEIYPLEGTDYFIWGKMKHEIFNQLLDCLLNSKAVKRKYIRMLKV